jgi:superfamily II DNA or RNA helicase
MQHELRDYQERAISNLREQLAAGKRRIVLQIPTGGGKTAVAGAMIRSALGKRKRAIFTVPALSLITQTIDSFKRDGIDAIGVMQGRHYMTNKEQPIQICSIQTLARRFIPDADFVIVDECHIVYDVYNRWFNDPAWADIPIIGLSATPWTKGLGKLYQGLVIGETIQGLIDSGHLAPFKAFAPSHVDLTGVRTVAGDYDLEGLDKAMNTAKLTADIVETWLEKGEDRPTLCFAVNRAHAQNICDAFNRAGVSAAYVDGETPLDERDDLAQDFKAGRYKIICNVGVMTTGVDLPFVSCLILARPTKSEMLYTQIVGRGLRPSQGKTDCIILDHSDTTQRLGFVTDIIHHELNDGKKRDGGVQKKREEPLPKECPKCTYLRPARMKVCPSCGFEAKPQAAVFTVDGTLAQVNGRGLNKTYHDELTPYEQRELFYRELLGIARERGFKSGWAFHQYRDKYKQNPDLGFQKTPVTPSEKTMNWVKHRWIKRAKAKAKAEGIFSHARFSNENAH